MNTAALLLSCLAVGQSAPATAGTPPGNAAGPRYSLQEPAPLSLPSANDSDVAAPSRTIPRGRRSAADAGDAFRAANPLRTAAGNAATDEFPAAQDALSPPASLATSDQAGNTAATSGAASGGASVAPSDRFTSGNAAADENAEPRRFAGEEAFTPPLQTGADQENAAPASSFTPAVVDESVVPTAGTQAGLIPVQPMEKEQPAERILRLALTPPEMNSLSGQPVTLDQLLTAGSYQQQQLTVAHAYWRLCTAVARYNLACEVQQTVEPLVGGRQLPLNAAAELAALRAETAQARAAAVDAQHALAALRGWTRAAELPLPVDRPVVAAYRTYYESLFPGQRPGDAAAQRAWRLHETLPLKREAIRALADTVVAREELAQAIVRSAQTGQADFHTLISALRDLHADRRALLSEVQGYNLAIADYAAVAIGAGGAPAGSLLPMLIKVKPPTGQTAGLTVTPQPSLQPVAGNGDVLPLQVAPVASGGVFVPGTIIQTAAETPVSADPAAAQMRSVLVRNRRLP